MTTHEAVELTLGLYDGSRVAVKCWGDERAPIKILALHGWLDNAATWDRLIPLLLNASLPVRVVAMDFVGHGNSSHSSMEHYLLVHRVVEVAAVADALRWPTFVLMGHSMGSVIASLVAGSIPHRIEKLILVEALGPFKSGLEAPEQVERSIKERPLLAKRQRKVYPTLEAALDRYVKNNPRILRESARLIVQRGTEEVAIATDNASDNTSAEIGYCYKHDPTLVGHEIISFPEKSVLAFFGRISCPVLVLLATNDALVKNQSEETRKKMELLVERRMAKLRNGRLVWVKGEHHVHLDQPELVEPYIVEFLKSGNVQPTSAKL